MRFWLLGSILGLILLSAVPLARADQLPALHQQAKEALAAGRLAEAEARAGQGLQLAREQGRRRVEAVFLILLGLTHRSQGQLERSRVELEQAEVVAAEVNDPSLQITADQNLGRVLQEAGDLAQAMSRYAAGLKLAKAIGAQAAEGGLLNGLGTVLQALDKHDQALNLFQEALEIASRLNLKAAEADTLINLAASQAALGQHTGALVSYQNARAIYRELRDGRGEGEALLGLARVLSAQGKHPEAIQAYKTAQNHFSQIRQPRGLAESLLGAGTVFQNLGQDDQALEYYLQAQKVFDQIADQAGRAAVLQNLARIYGSLGRFDQALQSYRQALDIFAGLRRAQEWARTLQGLAGMQQSLGQYDQALDSHLKAIEVFNQVDDRQGRAAALLEMGTLHRFLGRFSQAADYYRESLKAFGGLGDSVSQAKAINGLGLTFQAMGLSAEAAAQYQQAKDLCDKVGYARGAANSLENLGGVYGDQGQSETALDFYQTALRQWRALGSPEEIRLTQGLIGDMHLALGELSKTAAAYKAAQADPLRWGNYYLQSGQYPRAREMFAGLVDEGERTRNARALFAIYLGLGLSLEGLGRPAEAETPLKKAVALSEEVREAAPPGQRGRFFEGQAFGHRWIEAYQALIRVLTTLNKPEDGFLYSEHIKARVFAEAMGGPAGRSQLPQALRDEEQSLLDRLSAAVEERQKAALEGRSKAFHALTGIETGLRAELEKFKDRLWTEHPRYAAARYPRPLRDREIPLEPDEVLVSYSVNEANTVAFVLQAGQPVRGLSLGVNRGELDRLVEAYRAGFAEIRFFSQLKQLDLGVGRRLYDTLWRPVKGLIPAGAKVILVTEGALSTLPFEALLSEASGGWSEGPKGPFPVGARYLGDETMIRYAQSATALGLRRRTRPAPAGPRMLVVADPVFSAAPVKAGGREGEKTAPGLKLMRTAEDEESKASAGGQAAGWLPRLELTNRLAQRLKGRFRDSVDLVVGPEASRTRIEQMDLAAYSTIVLATHGLLGNQLLKMAGQVFRLQEPALALTLEDPARPENSFLTLSAITGLKLNAEWVMLTACQTALGRLVRGEGVMNMGRAFQLAGARHVLITLWPVNEDSSVELVELFLTQLAQGKEPPAALAAAREGIRREGFQHPFYWAGFIPIGD